MKHRCSQLLYSDRVVAAEQCRQSANIELGGQWWCHVHNPLVIHSRETAKVRVKFVKLHDEAVGRYMRRQHPEQYQEMFDAYQAEISQYNSPAAYAERAKREDVKAVEPRQRPGFVS